MNKSEQIKYRYHITTIRFNEQKASAWKKMYYVWQVFFFGGLFIGAVLLFAKSLDTVGMIGAEYALDITKFIEGYFYSYFGFLTIG